jgi:FdhD protein
MFDAPLEPAPPPIIPVGCITCRDGHLMPGRRVVPEETAVSLTYNKASFAVMMATPSDLEDFAVGFSLTEGIISAPEDIQGIEIVRHPRGIEARVWLAPERLDTLDRRRRHLAGAVGCGLCGLESLDAAMREVPRVRTDAQLTPAMIAEALAALIPAQTLHRETSALHAVGFWHPAHGLIAAREDIGRHNALDKLVGALARAGQDPDGGVVVLTSRVSVEMVQKAAVLGAPVLVAVSAPSALALRSAEAAGITLVAIARRDGFEAFTHTRRIRA